MTTDTAATRDAARHLWNEACRTSALPADTRATVEQLLTSIEAGLRRWIGAEGYAVLLSRATTMTLPAHAALAGFDDLGIEPAMASDDSDDFRSFTEAELADAIIALLTTMMTLLGGIIGADMAIRLLTLSGTRGTRVVKTPETNNSES